MCRTYLQPQAGFQQGTRRLCFCVPEVVSSSLPRVPALAMRWTLALPLPLPRSWPWPWPWSMSWFPVIVDSGTAHCNFGALWLANGARCPPASSHPPISSEIIEIYHSCESDCMWPPTGLGKTRSSSEWTERERWMALHTHTIKRLLACLLLPRFVSCAHSQIFPSLHFPAPDAYYYR